MRIGRDFGSVIGDGEASLLSEVVDSPIAGAAPGCDPDNCCRS